MPDLGQSFLPGDPNEMQRRRLGEEPLGAALKVLAMHLPKVSGAESLAPDLLLQGGGMFGRGGSPLANSIADQVIAQIVGGGSVNPAMAATMGSASLPAVAGTPTPAAIPQARPLTTAGSLAGVAQQAAARPSAPVPATAIGTLAPSSPTMAYQPPTITGAPPSLGPPRVVPGGGPVPTPGTITTPTPLPGGEVAAEPDARETLGRMLSEIQQQLLAARKRVSPLTDISQVMG